MSMLNKHDYKHEYITLRQRKVCEIIFIFYLPYEDKSHQFNIVYLMLYIIAYIKLKTINKVHMQHNINIAKYFFKAFYNLKGYVSI